MSDTTTQPVTNEAEAKPETLLEKAEHAVEHAAEAVEGFVKKAVAEVKGECQHLERKVTGHDAGREIQTCTACGDNLIEGEPK